jgi:hypothetical protein
MSDTDPYEREAAKAAIKVLKRELAEAREQRDGAFSLIDYAGELLGVPKQEHKSAHGFKILQAIKELAETRKDYKCLAELLDGHDATECRSNLLRMKQELADARKQRDTLAEAMTQMWPFIEEDDAPACNTPAFNAAIAKYKAALAAVKP